MEESTDERRYRELFDKSPISLWEQDYSGVKTYLGRLRDGGVEDIRAYLEEHPEAFIECARLVRVIDVNARTLELYGAGSKQELYDNLRSTVPAEAHTFFLDQLAAIAEGRTVFQGETVNLTLRGERLNIFIKWNLFPGVGYERVLVALIDVTERVKAEERLKESEQLYRMLADNTQDLICVYDLQGIARYVSPSVRTVLGHEPEELLGQPFITLVHPDEQAETVSAFAAGTPTGTSGSMRVRNRRKDGRYVWLDCQGTPLYGEGGELTGYLAVSRDVTEQVQAEEALREANEQLKDFLSIAAHELRHPINLVQGYVGTLQDVIEAPDRRLLDEIYSGIKRATGRLVHLVQELLEVSRIDQGRFFYDMREGSPLVLAEEAAWEIKARIPGSAVDITISGEPGTWVVDHDKFRQLMVVLPENAVNYSPAGSPVEVEMEVTGRGLEVSVLDRGRGVDAGERERIFQRFYQVDEPLHHSVPGLGMGLFIAREIVEGHGGRIYQEDRPGGGSAFRFVLPPAGKDNRPIAR